MDVSRKLYKENIITLNEFETELLKIDKKATQKDLIDTAINFARENKRKFLNYFLKRKIKNNTKEMTEKFLALPKFDFGGNWMEEIDTIGHEDMLRRNKK